MSAAGTINSSWHIILITYILYEAMYTCVNVPFGSLSSVMTDDVNHRTDLSRYRSLGGTIFMTVIVIVGPLVLYKDNKPVASRFTLMALLCATIGVFCLIVTSSWCKETYRMEGAGRQEIQLFRCAEKCYQEQSIAWTDLFKLAGMIAASCCKWIEYLLI